MLTFAQNFQATRELAKGHHLGSPNLNHVITQPWFYSTVRHYSVFSLICVFPIMKSPSLSGKLSGELWRKLSHTIWRRTWCFLQGTREHERQSCPWSHDLQESAAISGYLPSVTPSSLSLLPVQTGSTNTFPFSTHESHSALVGLFWCVCVPWRIVWVGKVDVHLTPKQKRKHSLLGAVGEDVSRGGKGWD